MGRRIKINNVFYCYHPDGVQDDNEPKGYRILPTGKWVVEWDICNYYKPFLGFLESIEHYKAEFKTEEEAEKFYNKILGRISPDGIFMNKKDMLLKSHLL